MLVTTNGCTLNVQCKDAGKWPGGRSFREYQLEVNNVDIFDMYVEVIPEPRAEYLSRGTELVEAWKTKHGKLCIKYKEQYIR